MSADPPAVASRPASAALSLLDNGGPSEAGDWETLFTQFMEDPTYANFRLLRCAACRSAFKSFKGRPEYEGGGSRNNKLTSNVIRLFAGECNAQPIAQFAQTIREVAGSDLITQFVLFMKLEGQARVPLRGQDDIDFIYLLTV